jgi:uncharacterized protein YdiU (UPF0061 family)
MLKKLGLMKKLDDDAALIQDLLQVMHDNQMDFTLTFRALADMVDPKTASGGGVGPLIELPEAFATWQSRWQQRLKLQPMDAVKRQAEMYAVNPAFIPRNHLVEEAISAAEKRLDFDIFDKLVDVLANPFEYDTAKVHYAYPPRPGQVVRQTFCGT